MLTVLRALATMRRVPLVAEAAIALLRAYALVRLWPFSNVARSLQSLPRCATGPEEGIVTARRVRGAIGTEGRRLPWRPTCLVRAVAAHAMLARRGVPATVVLSVAPRNEAVPVSAHAWLEAAGTVVTGGREMGRFTPIHRIGNESANAGAGAVRCSP